MRKTEEHFLFIFRDRSAPHMTNTIVRGKNNINPSPSTRSLGRSLDGGGRSENLLYQVTCKGITEDKINRDCATTMYNMKELQQEVRHLCSTL